MLKTTDNDNYILNFFFTNNVAFILYNSTNSPIWLLN